MTREELIALAKEADCAIHEIAELERFANIVAAKEREECAESVRGSMHVK